MSTFRLRSREMASHLEISLSRLRRGLSAVELVHTSHEHWPLPRHPVSGEGLNISVLDSSFNPPTLAHLALANTPFPHSFRSTSPHTDTFHAKLLLLSVRNVDKSLKPSDATYAQRLEMMISLAKEVATGGPSTLGSEDREDKIEDSLDTSNVAVGIIDQPTFVGKSQVLLNFLRERVEALSNTRSSGMNFPTEPKLTFLVGMDTLERLFAPRYYSSEQTMKHSLREFFTSKDGGCRVICGRRSTSGSEAKDQEEERRAIALAKDYIDSSHIALVDLGESLRTISSSEVRRRITSKDPSWSSMITPSIAEYITQHDLYSHIS
ncbi:hypothetical protein NLI96_g6067 [Meripilus lineatus]|uniref:Nicotinamide-nucleotide adenylyltransferase n=1 Tax=Meripilus lineatus TaxID=2056292 RepID=A0AAD5YIF5_9APHY|nr:hypothetical protein NLI96_g6067 [Physisporinus lineatus]